MENKDDSGFQVEITINCPVRFNDTPHKKWFVIGTFCIHTSDGTDDESKRSIVNFGFLAYPKRIKKLESARLRFVSICKERVQSVESLENDRKVVFTFLSASGEQRRASFIFSDERKVNLIDCS